MTGLTIFPTRPLPVRPRLFILVGIPGCGKSTWATTLGLGVVVSSDAIREELHGDANDQSNPERVFEVFHERIRSGLLDGHDVVADSTGLRDFAREKLRGIAAVYGAETHLVLFNNLSQAIIRNRQRERVVPDDVMRRMVAQYERAVGDIGRENYDSITEIRRVY